MSLFVEIVVGNHFTSGNRTVVGNHMLCSVSVNMAEQLLTFNWASPQTSRR